MKRIICLLSFILITSSVFCVGEAGAIFLLINPGSSAAGTGEAQVAKVNDAYASYYNPAGLAFLEGSEVVLQHVNWLPNLADDIFYDFTAYRKYVPGIGTFGGHFIYLNLGSQQGTDEFGFPTSEFKSYMLALAGSYGTRLNENSSIGMTVKLFHQKLADDCTGSEGGGACKPYSTDFAFDIGYLRKFGSDRQHNFGLSVQNIGPPIDFIDSEQSDPAPTNMKLGFFATLYEDETNKLNLLFDANKLLVASYPIMDWNGDGIISGSKELAHSDPWYEALVTSWLDDWYYGGDYDLFEADNTNPAVATGSYSGLDSRIGGYIPYDFNITGSGLETIFIPNYDDFCMTDEVYCYSENGLLIREGQNEELVPKYLDLPHDGQQEWTQIIDPISGEITGYEINLNTSDDSNDNGETFTYYDVVIDEGSEYEYSFKDSGYGEYNPYGNEEKGSGDNRSFSDELEEMIYNVGLEWWYTENFAMRLGFIYDIQGDIKNPTFGAGIKFNKYAFDFGYTSGPSGHPRANTMFFSLSLGL